MATIQVHDKFFEPYITRDVIVARIKELARAIEKDYAGKTPLFIAILNGSFMFASDLFQELGIPAEICFIKLASYKGTKSTGNVITSIGLDTDLFERDIIILEDIIDTGKTMKEFLPQLMHQHPASLKICALLNKPGATIYPLHIDYLGFSIPDRFVVGYGLDYDGLGRNIKELYKLAEGE
ncbi:MAG: hypoxanthine phosphoribosyltransferase [Chitinophagaceae bacterium]|nr:hypoxanthine phosphoribosyltransferase [Chitinophagaceae bacterium]